NILDCGRRNLSDLRASLCHSCESSLFKVRGSLHGVHKIRYKVGAALVDVLNLAPFCLGILVERHKAVVRSDKAQTEDHDNQYDRRDYAENNFISHFQLPFSWIPLLGSKP